MEEIIEYSFISSNTDEPKTVEEALNSTEAEEWKKAMKTEMGTLKKMGKWILEDLLKERQTVGSKWVFNKKRDKNGIVICYKAQLVAHGFTQKPGTDYSNDGTFFFFFFCTYYAI